MTVMRRACRAAPLLALAAPLFLLDNARAPFFCAASGTPPISVADDNAHHHQQQHDGLLQDGRQQAHNAATGGVHAEQGASTLVEGDPASADPEQVHIALAKSGSLEEYAMTVAWVTWPEARSQLLWGSSPKGLSNMVEGNATTYFYIADHLWRDNYTSGFLHSATMEGLQPSTIYYYSCGDENLAVSSVRSFVTPPKIGADRINLGIVGDLGQTEDSVLTLAAIDVDKSLDIVLHAGDLAYADNNQPRWDSFMRMLDPVASRLPWMVSAGNHEIEAVSTNGKPFLAYEKRFRMPASGPPVQGYGCGMGGGLDGLADGSIGGEGACGEGLGEDEAEAVAVEVASRLVAAGGGTAAGEDVCAAVRASARAVRQSFGLAGGVGEERGEFGERPIACCPSEWSGLYDYGNSFYSFEVGPVHVIVLNPYTSSGERSVQYYWLRKDLQSVDRTLTPWIVVMMHCPWYNSNLAHQGERQAEAAMRAMEPLLYAAKVAVVIAGHVHAYERSHPVHHHTLTKDGPIYLVVGGAGNREGHASEFCPKPEWSASRDGTVYGSGRLAIYSSSLAKWEWTASGEPNFLHDSAWVSNPFSPYTPEDTPPSNIDVGGVGLGLGDRVSPLSDEDGASGKGRVGGGLRAPRSPARVAL